MTKEVTVTQTYAARAGMRWRDRSKLNKMLIVALVVASASILPAAGSFVSRDSGNVLFGGEAQAACKTALGNYYDKWWFKASVITDWCYSGGHVTSRHSEAGGNVTSPFGVLAGWFFYDQHWEYSKCVTYNGVWNHNCLTQREFNLFNGHSGLYWSICIETRIYGDGHHHRHITEKESDACSM
jgi:hypothetical protein